MSESNWVWGECGEKIPLNWYEVEFIYFNILKECREKSSRTWKTSSESQAKLMTSLAFGNSTEILSVELCEEDCSPNYLIAKALGNVDLNN